MPGHIISIILLLCKHHFTFVYIKKSIPRKHLIVLFEMDQTFQVRKSKRNSGVRYFGSSPKVEPGLKTSNRMELEKKLKFYNYYELKNSSSSKDMCEENYSNMSNVANKKCFRCLFLIFFLSIVYIIMDKKDENTGVFYDCWLFLIKHLNKVKTIDCSESNIN